MVLDVGPALKHLAPFFGGGDLLAVQVGQVYLAKDLLTLKGKKIFSKVDLTDLNGKKITSAEERGQMFESRPDIKDHLRASQLPFKQ